MNCGWTAACAQRRAWAATVRAFAPLVKLTRAVMVWRADPERRSGTDTVSERWPGRTATLRTRRPLTKNVTWRISRAETVTRARREAQVRCTATRAVADRDCVAST